MSKKGSVKFLAAQDIVPSHKDGNEADIAQAKLVAKLKSLYHNERSLRKTKESHLIKLAKELRSQQSTIANLEQYVAQMKSLKEELASARRRNTELELESHSARKEAQTHLQNSLRSLEAQHHSDTQAIRGDLLKAQLEYDSLQLAVVSKESDAAKQQILAKSAMKNSKSLDFHTSAQLLTTTTTTTKGKFYREPKPNYFLLLPVTTLFIVITFIVSTSTSAIVACSPVYPGHIFSADGSERVLYRGPWWLPSFAGGGKMLTKYCDAALPEVESIAVKSNRVTVKSREGKTVFDQKGADKWWIEEGKVGEREGHGIFGYGKGKVVVEKNGQRHEYNL